VPPLLESNVRIPACAWDALEEIKVTQGVSRDEAVRQLLEEHVAAQEGRAPDDRLTHISTVLRYPPPPRLSSGRDLSKLLRVRLSPAVAEKARKVLLRLPGQSVRGHHDYQARLLTDAVVTAIAIQLPFTDEVLDGLLPVVRHRTAVGLWGLAVAATSTGAEREVYAAAEPLPRRAGARPAEEDPVEAARRYRNLLVAEVLREDVGWHDQWRFQVVAHLAGQLLCGDEADRNEQMLYDQHVMVWGQLRHDLENSVDGDHWLLYGLEGFHQDLEGRGGTAVWRAERWLSCSVLSCPTSSSKPGGRSRCSHCARTATRRACSRLSWCMVIPRD
jgi:hypothetical protein